MALIRLLNSQAYLSCGCAHTCMYITISVLSRCSSKYPISYFIYLREPGCNIFQVEILLHFVLLMKFCKEFIR